MSIESLLSFLFPKGDTSLGEYPSITLQKSTTFDLIEMRVKIASETKKM